MLMWSGCGEMSSKLDATAVAQPTVAAALAPQAESVLYVAVLMIW